MRCFLVHPTGNTNVRAILTSLEKSGMLLEFGTTISLDISRKWITLLPKGIKEELLRRSFPVCPNKVWTHPYLETARLISLKLGLGYFHRHELGFASVDAVYQDFDKNAANRLLDISKKEQVDFVYAYEDGALETFLQAKKLGIKCIYDLPIAYWDMGHELIGEEVDRYPEWAVTLKGGIKDSKAKLERKTKELELADIIVCPGKFVKDSIPSWALLKQKIVVPFGSPMSFNRVSKNVVKGRNLSPLRVLFVGSMGQRKGLADLFEAIRIIDRTDIELIVLGSLLAPMEFYLKKLPNFIYQHGRPHDQVLKLMRTCDVFCLPSIVEGRALVMQEAMSQGLPLIITPNTGGEDLIIEGKTGFLVPIRSPYKIAEKLEWFLDNRDQVSIMGRNAQDHASKYTWESYGAKIIEGLQATKY